MAIVPFFTKVSTAVFTIGLDFTDEMPEAGVTLESGVASARQRKSEADATATILSNGTTVSLDVDNNIGKITVAAGTKGVWYEVFLTMTCSNDHIIVGKAVLFIDE